MATEDENAATQANLNLANTHLTPQQYIGQWSTFTRNSKFLELLQRWGYKPNVSLTVNNHFTTTGQRRSTPLRVISPSHT